LAAAVDRQKGSTKNTKNVNQDSRWQVSWVQGPSFKLRCNSLWLQIPRYSDQLHNKKQYIFPFGGQPSVQSHTFCVDLLGKRNFARFLRLGKLWKNRRSRSMYIGRTLRPSLYSGGSDDPVQDAQTPCYVRLCIL